MIFISDFNFDFFLSVLRAESSRFHDIFFSTVTFDPVIHWTVVPPNTMSNMLGLIPTLLADASN